MEVTLEIEPCGKKMIEGMAHGMVNRFRNLVLREKFEGTEEISSGEEKTQKE